MADPIPTADPALLAAQSKAGQAGVDAYQAAISTLQSQRQSSVQQAMQEAAMRGSPAPAADSQVGTISSPYDQRIASLTQSQAAYHADMASRAQRMDDYNAAVQGARSFIPLQVEQAVAPIRQQGDNAARQEQIRGEQNVFGIQADTQLQMAKIQAAVIAAQIAAAKAAAKAKADAKLPSLNQSQLSGLEDPIVASLLANASSTVQGMLAANEKQRQSTATAAVTQSRLTPSEDQAAQLAAQNAQKAQLAAAYGGRGLAQAKTTAFAAAAGQQFAQRQGTQTQAVSAPAASPIYENPAAPPPLVRQPGMTPQEWKRYQDYMNSLRANQDQLSLGASTAPSLVTKMVNQEPLSPSQVQAARLAALRAVPTAAVAAGQQAYQGYRAAVQPAQQQATQFDLQRLLRPLGAPMQAARDARANLITTNPATGNQVGLSANELGGLDPLQQAMVVNGLGGGSMLSPEQFRGRAIGDPSSGLPAVDSSDVVRAAYQQAFGQVQGLGAYNIGPEDAAAAMPKTVPSIYDYLQGRSELPTAAQQIKQAQVADTAAGKGQVAADKQAAAAAKAQADSDVLAEFGRNLPASYGTSVAITSALADPATLAEFDSLDKAVQAALGTVKKPTHAALVTAVVNDMASQGLPAADPWLLNLAVAKNRYV